MAHRRSRKKTSKRRARRGGHGGTRTFRTKKGSVYKLTKVASGLGRRRHHGGKKRARKARKQRRDRRGRFARR